MSEPDLLQRQCEILHAFRQATAQRAKAEADAEARRKAELEAADAALNQARQTAVAQLAKAHKAWEEAQAALDQAELQHLLEQIRPSPTIPRPGANLAQELAHCVSVTTEATASIQADIEELVLEELLRWREAAASRRSLAVAAFFVIFALLILAAVLFSSSRGLFP
jgi:hypothetical protein